MRVWVNGCFDILHSGHIDLLWFAKRYGVTKKKQNKLNKLFVGLDSDERIKELKGDNRPINDLETRVKIMSSLNMVDVVAIFNTDDELKNYIKNLKIDCMVVGDEYKNKTVIGSEYSKYGVVYYPKTNGKSTTDIINKIKKL
ncbi:MAG TPA: adenylyltransferase/cytidyltransferase family protein [archaeon]|nr:adenylyltransferase/cytidyltransferase family protein [archaeon]